MLELKGGNSFTGVPYLTYDALDEYAELVVTKAVPRNLSQPTPLDVDAFLEFYLNLPVVFQRLSHGGRVLGLTAFDTGYIEVVDEENNQPKALRVKAGTVLIDNSLLNDPKSETRLRFTLMHEAAHWLLHQQAFSVESRSFHGATYLAAKEGKADYSPSKREKSDAERMERQADFLAAALLMPRPALRTACKAYWSYYKQPPMRIERGRDAWHNSHAVQFTKYIADQFHVSRAAAKIRLEKLGAIVGKETARSRA